MRQNSICLTAIVKNESKVIRRCIASALPWLTHYAIVDTGSTDGTQDIIRGVMAENDIPGTLIERPWVDFATNRNQALELARATGAEYLLLLDADEELVGNTDADLRKLTGAEYLVWFQVANEEATWTRQLLIRADKLWEYFGAVHEALKYDGTVPSTTMMGGIEVLSHCDGARNEVPGAKFESDILQLEKMVQWNPNDSRSWFYLGQSLNAVRRHREAENAYRRVVWLGGRNDSQVFYALYQIGAAMQAREMRRTEVAHAYQVAHEYDPSRAEPLWALAMLHNDAKQPHIAELYAKAACERKLPDHEMLVHRAVYEWRAAYELAAAYALQGRDADAMPILQSIKSNASKLNSADHALLEKNLTELAAE